MESLEVIRIENVYEKGRSEVFGAVREIIGGKSFGTKRVMVVLVVLSGFCGGVCFVREAVWVVNVVYNVLFYTILSSVFESSKFA